MENQSNLKDFFLRNEDTKVALCNLCNKNVSFKSSVINLIQHLALEHRESLVNSFPVVITNEEELPDNDSIPMILSCDSWSFFETVEGSTRATCTLCLKDISIKTGYSNLEHHLKLNHAAVYKNFTSTRSPTPPQNCAENSEVENGLHGEIGGDVSEDVINTEENISPLDEDYIIIASSQDESARKNRSAIWKVFDKIENTKMASCTFCQRNMSYKSTTANLKSHIRRLHPIVYHKYFISSKSRTPQNDSEQESNSEGNNSRDENSQVEHNSDDESWHEDKSIVVNSLKGVRKNNLWDLFQKIKNSKLAQCTLCDRKIPFKPSTSNLKIHLKRKHPTIYHEQLNISQLLITQHDFVQESGSEGNSDEENTQVKSNSEDEVWLLDNMLDTSKVTRKNRSDLWNFFERVENTKMAICTLCKIKISFKTTIGNLSIHLKRKHPLMYYKHFTLTKQESAQQSSSEDGSESEKNNSELEPLIDNKVILNSSFNVWKVFDRIPNTKMATCSLCQRNMSYKSTTANLRSHIRRLHPAICHKQLIASKAVCHPQNGSKKESGSEGNSDEENSLVKNDSEANNLLEGNSSIVPRKNKSKLWNYFDKIRNTKLAKCTLCQRNMSYKSSIANLKSHLRRIHPEKYLEKNISSQSSRHGSDEINGSEGNSSEHESFHVQNKSEGEHLPENNTFNTSNAIKKYESDNNDNSKKQDKYHKVITLKTSSTCLRDESTRDSFKESCSDNFGQDTFRNSSNVPGNQNIDVWNYFERNDLSKMSRCKLCQISISYKSSIANLKRHFISNHNSVYTEFMTKLASPKNIYEVYIPAGEDQEREEAKYEDTISSFDDIKQIKSDVEDYKPIDSQIDPFDSDDNFVVEPPKKVQRISSKTRAVNMQPDEKEYIDRCLLKLITEDFQPISIVEERGFKQFVAILNPKYKLPTKKTLSTILAEEYTSKLAEIKDISQRCSSISLTLDCWSARNMQSFMAVTAHFVDQNTFEFCSVLIQCAALNGQHTAERIASELRQVTCMWDITNKVKFIVSDNATNMISAARILNWPHFACYARKFNIIVQGGLNDNSIAEIVSKVQKTVAYIKRCAVAKKRLHDYQVNTQHIAQPKSLSLAIPTRWITVCEMLKRCSELQEAVRATVLNIDKEIPVITSEDWQCIDQLVEVLKPFEEAATIMSAEKYLIAGKAVVLSAGLYKVCADFAERQYCEPVTNLILKLKNGISTHFGDIEKNEHISVCTLLDPRFKQHAFEDNTAMINAKENVFQKLKLLNNESKVDSAATSSTTVSNPDSMTSLLGRFYTKVASSYQPHVEHKTIDELNRYLSENVIPPTECSLKWWRERRILYPSLSKIFVACSNIVVTSLLCEKAFSKTGYILSDRLTRLTTSKVDKIMFLNVNK